MNILHLKYAVEVAKAGSINKAAENLLMGQPNLSRAIRELEGSLGIAIFDRSAKGMFPTPEGEEFLSRAKKILQQIDEVEQMYKSGTCAKQKFSISVPRASYIAEAFAKFSNKLSGNPAEIFYNETNSYNAVKNILSFDYRLGIIRYAVNHDRYFKDMLVEKGLDYEIIAEFKPVLIFGENSPLAKKEKICISDLKGYIEIANGDPFVPSMSLTEAKKEELSEYTDRKIFVYERAIWFELLAENSNAFMWGSPVPDKMPGGLVQRECIDNKRVYKDVLIYRRDYRLSKLDNIFITELCNSKRKYLKDK